MQKVFSDNTKMADMVLGNPQLLLMFPRFGMDLGFGDRSVGEVCAMNNVSTPFFLMVCNIYSNDDYSPTPEDVANVDLKALISYLLESPPIVNSLIIIYRLEFSYFYYEIGSSIYIYAGYA